MQAKDINNHVQQYYARFFLNGTPRYLPVETGKDLARALDYPLDKLWFVQEEHWAHFIPCGNPLPHLSPTDGDRILNLGCGVGVDSYALSRTCSYRVKITGLDVVQGILQKAKDLFHDGCGSGEDNLNWICGDGQHLPFREKSFQWVIMNGVFNLFPEKHVLLREIERILTPSGRLICADLCCETSLPDYFGEEADSWAWCMSGACTEEELSALCKGSSLELVELLRVDVEDMLYRVVFTYRKT